MIQLQPTPLILKLNFYIRLLNHSMQKISQVNLSNKYMVNMGVQLGKGSTGSVYEGKDLLSNETVAVKVIELSTIDNQVTHYLLEMEKIALMAISSPYILKGLKIWQDKKFCFMVTEYCNGGTLKQYIQKNGKLDEDKSVLFVHKILEGYQHLVDKKIVHRDLKPANIMIHNDCPKIIDFGYCEIDGYQKPSLEYNVGSPSYMAPQAFDLNIYNEKTEIWAIGVILFECVTGRTIDEGRKMTLAYKQIQETGIPYPSHVSQRVRKTIDWCLNLNPRRRPTCEQLLNQFKLSRPQSRSLFSSITNESLLSNRKTYDSREFIENQNKFMGRKTHESREMGLNQSKDLNEYQILRSTQASGIKTVQKNHHLERPAILMQSKYIQNRVRPAFSNYVKPKSSNTGIQQPEVYSYKVQNTDRLSRKAHAHNTDYGLSKIEPTSFHMRKKNNFLNPSSHTFRESINLSGNIPSLHDKRAGKRVESHYTRPYRV